jgi:glutamate racemase
MSALPGLAILDWGIGGFGLVAALQSRHPGVAYTYFSDSGFAPYGKVEADALAARLAHVARHLQQRGVRQLAIACNAASTVVSQTDWPQGLQVHDVIRAGLAQCLAEPVKHLGIVGGRRTIVSRALANPLRKAGRKVSQRVAQPLSAHVERGNLDGADLRADLDRILAPLHGIDGLLLACTHYPAIAGEFQRRLPGVRLFDPVQPLLQRLDTTHLATGSPRILTSGDATAMARGAMAAFGVDIRKEQIECVTW